MRSWQALGVSLLLAASGAHRTVAEPTAEPAQFGERVDVRIVNVDVYVLGKDGRPIAGLTSTDFELFEDGKSVAITNFAELADGPAASAPEPSPAAPPTDEEAGAAARSESAPITVALYFDDQFLRPPSRARAVEQLRRFLPTAIRPDDQLVVFTSGHSAAGRHAAGELEGLLRELDKPDSTALRRDVEWRSTIETMRRIFDTEGCDHKLESMADSYAAQLESDARAALSSLTDAVAKLGALPGGKSLFYISDGIPTRPGEDLSLLIADWCGSIPHVPLRELAPTLRTVGAYANAHRVTLFTFEAGGLKGTTGASAEFSQNIVSLAADRARIENQQDSLTSLASETGGLAILNANDLAPSFGRVAQALRNHYSLGFSPRAKQDGKEHRIKVKLAKRLAGAELRFRQSYRG